MTFQNTEGNSGTATGTDVIDEPQGLDDILGSSGEATPEPSKEQQSSGKSGDSRESDDSGEDKVRSLAELNEIANDRDAKLTEAERKKVLIAARKGLTTDEEVDAELQKVLEGGKDKTTQSDTKKTDDSVQDEKDQDDQDDDVVDEEGEEDSETDSDEEEGDDDSDLTDAQQALQELITLAAPHAKTTEDATKAIKNLKYTMQRQGEFINAVKKSGFKSPEELTQAAETLHNIDKTVEELLKTPEGLQKLYKQYNAELPDFVNGKKAEYGTGDEEVITSDDLDIITKKVKDQGFIEADEFAKLIPAVVQSVKQGMEKEMSGMKEQMAQVSSFLTNQTKTLQRQEEMRQVFEDASMISSTFGEHDARLALEDTPMAIYQASIDESGKLRPTPHPEFKKLQNLVKVRQQAFKHAQALSKKLGKEVVPDVMGYMSKLFMTSGGFKNVVTKTKKEGNARLLSNLAKKLQPGLGKGNKSSGSQGFKVPKNADDVAAMSKKDKQRFLKRVRSGQFKIQV